MTEELQRQAVIDSDLFEVRIVPRDPGLAGDMLATSYHTMAKDAEAAIGRVRKHLTPDFLGNLGDFDFVVHRRPMVGAL